MPYGISSEKEWATVVPQIDENQTKSDEERPSWLDIPICLAV